MAKNSRVGIAIFFVGLALAGLIGVQVYWISYTYGLSEKEFSARAKDALQKTVDEINHSLVCYEVFSKVHINPKEGFYLMKNKWENNNFLEPEKSRPDTIPMYYNDTRFNVDFRWNNLMFTRHVNVSMVFQFRYTSDGRDTFQTYANTFEKATLQNYQDALSEVSDIENLYTPAVFDSILKKNLASYSIDEPFRFGYIDVNKNKVIYSHKNASHTGLTNGSFRLRLTPSEYFSRPYDAVVVFDDYQGSIFFAFRNLLALSIVIIFILAFSFLIFIKIVLKQRRLSELKSDFINNMTHEFKTPLTNISLAVESITEQQMFRDPRGEKIIRIVGQESERLRENIERILQISRYEKEKLHLSPEKIDLHQLIKKVIDVFEPLIKNNKPVFICNLNAVSHFLIVDETHFFNMLYNILDNAIKYNTGTPEIVITTGNVSNGLQILIRDNGIGIAANDLKNVFEKFFRVQRGDLHDVKGYGLGLSYAKLVVESHHGYIKVNSQPNKGTEFELLIPGATT